MWDERYGQDGWAYGTEPNDYLREQAARIPDGEVLCLAEGQGRNAIYLASLGYRVHAVDSSAIGMQRAQALAEERGVALTTEQVDLAHYDLGDERWSGIVGIFAHVPPPVRAAMHEGVVAGLAPGGVYICEAYAPAQAPRDTGGPPSAELCYPVELVRQELAGLRIERAEELEREVVEGRYHTGLAVVTQIIAFKDE